MSAPEIVRIPSASVSVAPPYAIAAIRHTSNLEAAGCPCHSATAWCRPTWVVGRSVGRAGGRCPWHTQRFCASNRSASVLNHGAATTLTTSLVVTRWRITANACTRQWTVRSEELREERRTVASESRCGPVGGEVIDSAPGVARTQPMTLGSWVVRTCAALSEPADRRPRIRSKRSLRPPRAATAEPCSF